MWKLEKKADVNVEGISKFRWKYEILSVNPEQYISEKTGERVFKE